MMHVVVTQIPVPPPLPAPPAPPVIAYSGGGMSWPIFVLFLGVIAVLLWPLVRAWAHRIEGRADEALQRQVDDLEQRVAELAQREQHIAELEERLDFAERLLAQRADPASLPTRTDLK